MPPPQQQKSAANFSYYRHLVITASAASRSRRLFAGLGFRRGTAEEHCTGQYRRDNASEPRPLVLWQRLATAAQHHPSPRSPPQLPAHGPSSERTHQRSGTPNGARAA